MKPQMLPRLILCLLTLSFSGLSQEVITIAPEKEAELKARVSKFWDGFVSGKYRQSDLYVAESAKEDFFAWPKKRIRGYTIDKIYYADKGKAAKVMSLVDTTFSMMGIGAMDIKQPIETWWQEEGGTWYWFRPPNELRDTPFGKMESGARPGEAPLIPTGQMSATPTKAQIEALMSAVKPDRQELHFTAGTAKTETISIKNGMPGVVTLMLDVPPSEEVLFEIDTLKVSRGASATLKVKYSPSKQAATASNSVETTAKVSVAQTGKIYPIKIVIDPAK